ncbi:hypothetical protein niasHT_014987 [Heterodera trifolii]|uniref:DNA-directed DNA polymerase n=1 Tax=Heterodera trifolii TaxID=157864 RepID=A0ABD2L594_9BILA
MIGAKQNLNKVTNYRYSPLLMKNNNDEEDEDNIHFFTHERCPLVNSSAFQSAIKHQKRGLVRDFFASGTINTCEGTGEHILCKKLIAADLDPVLDKQGGVGPMIVTTPLQGLITIFILRSNIAMAASKELFKSDQAVARGADDVERHWTNNCAIVHEALKATGYRRIKLDAPIAVSELPEADRILWQKVFDGGSWALEKVRAAVIHGKTTLVQQPRVSLAIRVELQFPRPLCLIVVSIDHRPEQQTPAGLLSVTNVVLRNADGHRIEASGWQTQAGVLASLSIGTAYWFMNCMARSRYQRLDCWYRIGVDGRNATIIPHPTQQAQPIQIQTGSGSNEVNGNVIGSRNQLRSNQTNEEDVNNNNNVNHSIDDSFVIERTTPMRNTLRNTRGEVCEIRFLPLEDNERPDLVMESLIQHLLDRVLEGHSSPMLVGLQLQPPGFDRPYVIRLRPPEQNNAAALAAAIERLNEQSAAGIDLLSGTTVTKVLAVWPLESVRADAQRGGACDLDNEHHLSHKVQSLVRVVNPNDRYCLARAVLLGLCDRETRMPNGGGREEFNTYARRQNQHGTQAIHLLTNAGVPVDKHMYTLEDVEQLQQYINNENGVGQIRLVVFEKEQEYRIVFKGEGTAARFNLCILLERGHFNYIGRIAQLFKVPGYCIDCERRADARYHAIGCKAACRLCFRFGAGYPCQRERLSDGRISSRKCTECDFIFPNDNCYEYHLTNDAPAPIDGRGHRQRRSLCQWRCFCPTCGRVAYFGIHQCPSIRRAIGPVDCFRCKGPHMLDEPCFIQPIGVAAPLPMLAPVHNNDNNNSENDIDFIINNLGGEGDEDDTENGDDINEDDDDDDDDDERLPLRLCFFDAETSQERPLQLNNQVAHKHVPLLIVAEFICEPCIRAGININDGQGQRAPGCVCLCGRVRGQQMRQWMSPPFVNAPGDNTSQPEGAPVFNNRRFFFHSFDNEASDPVDQFLDFLIHHGSRKAHTICIAHNGGKYDFHLVLEALHRRSYPPKRLCTSGLKIYSMKLRGMNQRRITFKDSINYFFCELDALVKSFDLPQHLATVKPFFPYLYIQRQHLHHRLNGLPAIEFYSPNTMKADKREKISSMALY